MDSDLERRCAERRAAASGEEDPFLEAKLCILARLDEITGGSMQWTCRGLVEAIEGLIDAKLREAGR